MCGYYAISYEYFLDGKRYAGGEGELCWQNYPEFAPGKTITINIGKDRQGHYVSCLADIGLWLFLAGLSILILTIWIIVLLYVRNASKSI